jgi:hypothetical protein
MTVHTHAGSTRAARTRAAGGLLVVAVLLAACTGTTDPQPPPSDSRATTPASRPSPDPAPPTLDEQAATALYLAYRQTVYALAPVPPDRVDVAGAGDAIVVADSQAAEWITEELELARQRGVVVRGDVHAEAIPPVDVADQRATVTICSSAELRITDVATGEPASDEVGDSTYTRFDVTYRRIGQHWLIERAERGDDRDCVPPTIHTAITTRWEQFTEAWYERDRRGGGDDLGQLPAVITDAFADVLRELPPREPVAEPAPFTDFTVTAATRTEATGRACRSGGLETIEWLLLDGQWRVDFAGRVGPERIPCP